MLLLRKMYSEKGNLTPNFQPFFIHTYIVKPLGILDNLSTSQKYPHKNILISYKA